MVSFILPDTGHLQQSIGWRGLSNGEAEVYAQKEYAPFVEFGTNPPSVLGAKAGRSGIKIPVPGKGYVIRNNTNKHPGSKPHPFFFADHSNREDKMQDKMISVLATYLDV